MLTMFAARCSPVRWRRFGKGAVISFRALDATIRARLHHSKPVNVRAKARYLVFELLQWSAQTATFDDRAVDFAVTEIHRRRWKR